MAPASPQKTQSPPGPALSNEKAPAGKRTRDAGAYSWLGELQRTAGNQAIARAFDTSRKMSIPQSEGVVRNGEEIASSLGPATFDDALENSKPQRQNSLADTAVSLPAALRAELENHFGENLGNVRLYTGTIAEEAADAYHANAFALGDNLFFGRGQYSPEHKEGRLLLAHEVSHVIQQRRTGIHGDGSEQALEAEAWSAAERVARGERAQIKGTAERTRPHFQHKGGATTPKFKTGSDVRVNAAAMNDILRQGALFSGADQGHIRVTNGVLTYDENYITPDDPFRWDKLTDIIDSGHVQINAVQSSQTFPVMEQTGSASNRRDLSIDEIKLRVGDLSVTGVTLVRASVEQGIRTTEQAAATQQATATHQAAATQQAASTKPNASGQATSSQSGAASGGGAQKTSPAPTSGWFSTDNARDEIFYDPSAGLGNALAHELFGHYWLSLKGVPFEHPPAGTAQEKLMGTLQARHGIQDPFGSTFTGTVKDFIAKYIESGEGTARVTSTGKTVKVATSATEKVSQQHFTAALRAFIIEAKTGLKKTTTATGSNWTYTSALADQLLIIRRNYNKLGASDQKLVKDFLADKWFKTKLNADQQKAFQIMLQQVKGKSGFAGDQFTDDMMTAVGGSQGTQMYSNPGMSGPGSLQLSNP